MRFETYKYVSGVHVAKTMYHIPAVIINNTKLYITILTNANKFYKPKYLTVNNPRKNHWTLVLR